MPFVATMQPAANANGPFPSTKTEGKGLPPGPVATGADFAEKTPAV